MTQDLAYSAKDANSDLDSYFDNLQQSNVRANHAHSNDAAMDDDGLPTLTKQKSRDEQEQAAVNKEELDNYKKNNPMFKKQMDEVRMRWPSTLIHLPRVCAGVVVGRSAITWRPPSWCDGQYGARCDRQ